MSTTSPYKPSPLSFGSPRSSPFRRPESPSSPSTVRATTPTAFPANPPSPGISPNKLNTPIAASGWISRGPAPSPSREPPLSPTRGAGDGRSGPSSMRSSNTSGDSLAKLKPAQVREMREAFHLLDRDSDGQVTRDDVVDVLTNLGQDASAATVSPFFPPGQQQTLTLPTFLTTLSTLLSPLSVPQELLNAFAAFDDDDSGQVDISDLRDALLNTSPEAGERALTERDIEKVMGGFAGRRAFGKNSGGLGGVQKGEVFRYQEFVDAVTGGSTASNSESQDKKE
ncbi:MAG: hypothetical protein M1812_000166 [Candelaria pacifica]|nr:MAG: hypothetical protein M1812_000166 [Candelaria pacifica]